MKKVLALVLAIVLVLALAVTAFAAETTTGGTITITGTASTVYTVYKMYNIEIAIDGGQLYKVTPEWADFAAPGYFTVDNNGYVIWGKNAVNPVDGAAVAQLAVAYMEGKTFASVGTADVNNALNVADNGYYLLVADDGTANGAVSIVGGENQSVIAKTQDTDYPTLVKKVKEDSTGEYADKNSVNIGQEVLFHNTITIGSNASNYILHDRMDECLVMDWDSLTVSRGTTVLEEGVAYNVVKNCDNGCTFHIEFVEAFCNSLLKGGTLTVSYKATLKKDAEVDTEHKNTAWLTHTNGIPSDEVSTSTYTYKIVVNKVDQEGNPLPGATFVLKDTAGKYYAIDENGMVDFVANIEDATKLETTEDNSCQVVFYGVDADVYTLVEYEIPGGYTGATDIVVNTMEFVNGIRSKEVTVTNTRGMALPETGGVGTTMFYGFGALLVAAAVVLLILKKRANSAA